MCIFFSRRTCHARRYHQANFEIPRHPFGQRQWNESHYKSQSSNWDAKPGGLSVLESNAQLDGRLNLSAWRISQRMHHRPGGDAALGGIHAQDQVSQESINELVAMGFSRSQVEQALRQAGGRDINRAANILMAQTEQ